MLTLPLATKVLRLNLHGRLHRPNERMDAPKCMTLVPGIRRRELIGAAVLMRLSLSLFTRNSRSQVSIGFPFEFPPINFEIHQGALRRRNGRRCSTSYLSRRMSNAPCPFRRSICPPPSLMRRALLAFGSESVSEDRHASKCSAPRSRRRRHASIAHKHRRLVAR